MYKSSSDSMRLYPYNPTVRFSHVGGANDSIEAVFIQFYEPSKDPNRVLFFGENLDGLGVNEMDTWIDSETQAGTGNDIMNQVLIASPESDISVQYEIVQRKRIDENNLWNYFGAAPQFIETTELAITHNDAIDLGGNNFQEDPRKVLGSVRVTPTSFRRRIITERRNNTFISEFGAVGGTVANLFALYAFLFGMKPSNPWGFVQRSAQQKKAKLDQLLNYFEVNDIKAIPLVTPVHKRYEDLHHMNVCKEDGLGEHKEASHTDKPPSEEESPNLSEKELSPSELQRRIELIEGRSQTLELILKAYYIHDEIFEQLKEAKKEKAEKEKAEKEEAEKEEAKKENSELQEAEKGNSELQKAEGDNSQVTLHNENLLDITTGHP
jgi:hypothetical protein